MGIVQKVLLALADLGKGLHQNTVTKLIDVSISADAGNAASFGSDNGLYVSQSASGGIATYSDVDPSNIAPNTPYIFHQDAAVGGQLQAFTGAYLTTQDLPDSYDLRFKTPGGAILVFRPYSENQNQLQVYVDTNKPDAQLGDQWITEVSEQAGGVICGFAGTYLTTEANPASTQFRAFTPNGIKSVQMQ